MQESLRILHVLRAPVGGLFRHVIDLATAQEKRGHAVGIVHDTTTGNVAADRALETLAARLGIHRVAMSRHIGFSDFGAAREVGARIHESKADIVHGHGAKGGAYARLASNEAIRAYTPHGGTLHYGPYSPLGLLYLTLERQLARRTDLFIFESEYGLATFRAKLGAPPALARVVHNGVRADEFVPIVPDADAADVIFVGELRHLKGVDVLIEALAPLIAERKVRNAVLFGDGPDAAKYRAEVKRRGLSAIQFGGIRPAREAFRRGRVFVVPSRAESLPYVVLEAAAAAVPMVATRVGGIAEIFGPDADALVPPDDPSALARAIVDTLRSASARTQRLQARVAHAFTVEAMAEGVLAAYREAFALRPSIHG